MITVLCQIGGFGIMALATLLALLVSQRLGLRSRLHGTGRGRQPFGSATSAGCSAGSR